MACRCNRRALLCRCRRASALALLAALLVLPVAPALADLCPERSPCPLMAAGGADGPPCAPAGAAADRGMDCCVGGAPAEPAETDAMVVPDGPSAVTLPASDAATVTRPVTALRLDPLLAAPADGPPLFLLHAVFRL